jgi:hypothetical protein
VGCDSQSQANPISLVQNGISIQEFKKQIKSGEYISEPLSNYGIDSENSGWTFIKNDKKILFIWSKQNSNFIEEIVTLSPSLLVDDISVGNTLNAFLKRYPNAEIKVDVVNYEYQYAATQKENYTIEFLMPENKIAEFNDDYTLKSIINRDAKIDRIRVYRHE